MSSASINPNPLATLRKFMKPRAQVERCELCGLALGPEHQHLIEPAVRKLVCACDACAILFSGQASVKYRRVPRRIEMLADFRLTDLQWENLHLPINLAFFYVSSPAQRVMAMYPSPAGATESMLSLQAWEDLKGDNPMLGELEPDVEAILINRIAEKRQYCRAPIDECFKLVGLIRAHWRGLSGGVEVWGEIAKFFVSLEERSVGSGGRRA